MYDGPKLDKKPIAILRPGHHFRDHHNSILSAHMNTGIHRVTLMKALYTGHPIKKGKGKGCTVTYRNPEVENKRLKQYEEFKAKKELAAFGLTTTEVLSEVERLKVFENLYYTAQRKIKDLESQLRCYNIVNNQKRGHTY